MPKKTKQPTISTKKPAKKPSKLTGKIQGIAMLFVILSIAFSSYVVIMGVDDMLPKALLIPQVLFATCELTRKFLQTK